MSRKLYVLVRSDLSRSQQAVQAGHAVARFLSQELRRFRWNGREHESLTARWDNETLVYLRAGSLQELQKLHNECVEPWAFFEPDLNDEMTAFAVLDPPDWFDMLRLL
jgi:peptidyl-tRNA hydrolase